MNAENGRATIFDCPNATLNIVARRSDLLSVISNSLPKKIFLLSFFTFKEKKTTEPTNNKENIIIEIIINLLVCFYPFSQTQKYAHNVQD